jgi:hypothetical protein
MKLIRLLVLLIVVVFAALSGGIAASADTWGWTDVSQRTSDTGSLQPTDVIDPGGLSLPSPADVIDPGGL